VAAGDEHGRPTIRPPFDMAAFARKATGAGPEAPPTLAPPPPPVPAIEPLKVPRPSSARVVPRPSRSLTPSPNSIEGALLGVVEGPAAPVVTEGAIDDPIEEMRLLLSVGDAAAALELAEIVLAEHPGHAEALECRQKCQAMLEPAARDGAAPGDTPPRSG